MKQKFGLQEDDISPVPIVDKKLGTPKKNNSNDTNGQCVTPVTEDKPLLKGQAGKKPG